MSESGPLTPKELRWLKKNWSPGETAFAQWLAGSNTAHRLLARLIDQVAAKGES